MTNLTLLPDNWRLVAIDPGEPSPMENHLGGEIAVDEESKTFFAWHVFIVCYGLDSILASCRTYIAALREHKDWPPTSDKTRYL